MKITVCSADLARSLVALGVHEHKTYEQDSFVFDNIPDELKRYFILGFFDGDGYFSKENSEHKNLCGCVSLNRKLICSLVDYINSVFNEDFARAKLDGKYSRICLTRNKAKIFGDWLYEDKPSIYLKRKFENYNKFTFGSKAHYGFDCPRTKGVVCIESNKFYVTTGDAAEGEFTELPNKKTLISAIGSCCRNERKICHGKHFRYMTEDERNEFINGKYDFQVAEE